MSPDLEVFFCIPPVLPNGPIDHLAAQPYNTFLNERVPAQLLVGVDAPIKATSAIAPTL